MPEIHLPRFYPILDVSLLRNQAESRTGQQISPEQLTSIILDFAAKLAGGGASLIQYRNKVGTAREMLHHCKELKRSLGSNVRLIMNDRADIALAAGFDGIHVGQEDMSVGSVRRIVGPDFIVGTSTHNAEQVMEADRADPSYMAIGPVFATSSKEKPDPVIGLEGIREARKRTRKPLVAIGGITRQNCHSVLEAGADSIAVISDLLSNPGGTSQQFCRILL